MIFLKKRMLALMIFVSLVLLVPIRIAYCSFNLKGSLNFVFITIDTLRADHLGCYGYKDIKTPNIDALAKKGVLFSNAYSPVPLTLPSHVSIFTGVYPIQHGIQNNGTFELKDPAVTIAEIFKGLGYKTGAVVASFILASHYGLDQGFDTYDDFFFQNKKEVINYNENYRLGEDVTDIAKKWLKENRKKPFFLWLHYFDPHAPYIPPAPFDKSSPYDGEIEYTDKCLGGVIAEMERLSLLEKTCIILVSDHGEGLWEHNEETHGLFIYNSTLRVPLIISYPRLFPKGKRIDSQVGIIDIMPTVLELLNTKSEKHVEGISLIPLLTGKAEDVKRDIYCESLYSFFNFNWAPLEGVITSDGWKYIIAPKQELYNIREDPHEKTNLLSENPELAKSLKERLLSLREDLLEESHSQEGAKRVELSPEAKERLRSLGYIGCSGSSDEVLEDQNIHMLPDPKDKAYVLVQLDRARDLEGEGELEKAVQKYEEVLKMDSENKMALFNLGLIYSNTGRQEKAIIKLNRLNELDPQNYDSLNSLGLIYDGMAMPDKAIKAYKAALQINPRIAYIHHNLGQVYLKLNKIDQAAKEFNKMLSLTQDPIVQSMAVGNLGGIYARQGDLKNALEKFKESLKFNSFNHDAHISLATAYYDLGDIEQAIEEWKKIVKIWSDDYISFFRLAQLFFETHKSDMAVKYLKECIRIRPDFIDARRLLDQINQGLSFNRF